MNCIVCDKEVLKEHRYRIIAIERPVRLNIKTHRECYESIDGLNNFLQEFLEEYLRKYNYIK